METKYGIWQKIVKLKYLQGHQSICRQSDSPVWYDMLKVKDIYLSRVDQLQLKMGEQTMFQKDTWLYDMPLCMKFSLLFEPSDQQNITVAQDKKGDIWETCIQKMDF